MSFKSKNKYCKNINILNKYPKYYIIKIPYKVNIILLWYILMFKVN